jgi:hypothetical protein
MERAGAARLEHDDVAHAVTGRRRTKRRQVPSRRRGHRDFGHVDRRNAGEERLRDEPVQRERPIRVRYPGQVPRLVSAARDGDDVPRLLKLEEWQVRGEVRRRHRDRDARVQHQSGRSPDADEQVREFEHERLGVGEDEVLEADLRRGECAHVVGARPVHERAVLDGEEVLARPEAGRVPRVLRAAIALGSNLARERLLPYRLTHAVLPSRQCDSLPCSLSCYSSPAAIRSRHRYRRRLRARPPNARPTLTPGPRATRAPALPARISSTPSPRGRRSRSDGAFAMPTADASSRGIAARRPSTRLLAP